MSAPQRRSTRVPGLDMARALAILGMVMVHFGPFRPDTDHLVGWVYRTSYGRASILFVLLAGVGVTLLFGGHGRPAKDPSLAWRKVGFRVAVFLPLGVALQSLDTPVAVILSYYAAYYVLAALAQQLPTRWLVTLTGLAITIGPLVYVTAFDPDLAGRGTSNNLLDPVALATDLLVTGFYPLLTWGAPVLVGVLIGRVDLADRADQLSLTAGGAVVAAAAYGGSELARGVSAAAARSPYLLAEGHTGAPLNVIGATGVAVAVLGISLVLADLLPRLTWPLVAVGQMALTVYVGHLLLLAVMPEWLESRDSVDAAVLKVARFYLATTLICVGWRLRFARGPLEALLVLPFRTRAAPQQDHPWPPSTPHTSPASHSAVWSPPAPRASPPWTATFGSSSGTPPQSS